MLNSPLTNAAIVSSKAVLRLHWCLRCALFPRFAAQQYLTHERDKGHGDDARCDERACDDHWQRKNELARVTMQQQERKIGQNVRHRGEEDCPRQLRGTKPSSNFPWPSQCKLSLEAGELTR